MTGQMLTSDIVETIIGGSHDLGVVKYASFEAKTIPISDTCSVVWQLERQYQSGNF